MSQHLLFFQQDVDRYSARLAELEREAVKARDGGLYMHRAHVEAMEQTRALMTLAIRSAVRMKDALKP